MTVLPRCHDWHEFIGHDFIGHDFIGNGATKRVADHARDSFPEFFYPDSSCLVEEIITLPRRGPTSSGVAKRSAPMASGMRE
jgi:hypothetical protein